MRYQDAVAVFDWEEGRLVWSWGQNELQKPHEASLLPSGNILVVDNGHLDRGYSRVVEMDPRTEEIVWEYPDDIEAKAFLVNRLWLNNRYGSTTTSRQANEAILQQIFDVQPLHPAHHYRIHLWDAADSAKICCRIASLACRLVVV